MHFIGLLGTRSIVVGSGPWKRNYRMLVDSDGQRLSPNSLISAMNFAHARHLAFLSQLSSNSHLKVPTKPQNGEKEE